MAKKNPYIFTIGFDENNPTHVKAAEILNNTKGKAQLIASAILSYLGEPESTGTGGLGTEHIQSIVINLIRDEVKKALESSEHHTRKEPEAISIIKEEEPLQVDDRIVQNVSDAISAFRKMK